ncbi:probable WRKY transcription factor 32 isoform X2 [Salvia splendens]|uniref:probable WRKY transcription factor 32 isoform X2 n=1 Tax=Salvia splendens TaxID=180675 RepID=UPI001C26C843|nr:probable WRKY transcription factor 32 isoform X2 [Salvia splendens]
MINTKNGSSKRIEEKKSFFILSVRVAKARTSHTDSVRESAMEGANNRSSDASREKVREDSEPSEKGEAENRDDKAEKIDEQRRVSSDSSTDYTLGNSSRGESKAQLQTLASAELPAADSRVEFDDSSDHLSEVPVEYSLQPVPLGGKLKDQIKEVNNGVPKDTGGRSKSSAFATKLSSSIASSNPQEQKLQPVESESNVCVPEPDKQNTKRLSIVPMPRIPSDGYNWRKYGQKQVKSPEGSRSYYRCTFSECSAKKIECCDISNRLIETVYKSHHNHDPPQKLNSIRENKPTLSTPPVNQGINASNLVSYVNDLVPSTPSKEHVVTLEETPETKQESSDSEETTGADTKEMHGNGPESKKRQKRNYTGEVESLHKPGKKPQYVVHAAGDMGISGDGYRWRKYGQKMVKGNPHPRNYYRCTSAGCPVRKHIERAVDNSSAVVITYKGIHDHDTPVPRKRHGPKDGNAVATSPISLNDVQSKSKPHKTQQTQWSVGKEGELTGEALVGGDKASESARTLLSVGFEIKPC